MNPKINESAQEMFKVNASIDLISRNGDLHLLQGNSRYFLNGPRNWLKFSAIWDNKWHNFGTNKDESNGLVSEHVWPLITPVINVILR